MRVKRFSLEAMAWIKSAILWYNMQRYTRERAHSHEHIKGKDCGVHQASYTGLLPTQYMSIAKAVIGTSRYLFLCRTWSKFHGTIPSRERGEVLQIVQKQLLKHETIPAYYFIIMILDFWEIWTQHFLRARFSSLCMISCQIENVSLQNYYWVIELSIFTANLHHTQLLLSLSDLCTILGSFTCATIW